MSYKKQDNSVPDVTVVDTNRRYMGYTRRGKARKLVSSGKARWLQKDPPVLIYVAKAPEKITYRRKEMNQQTKVKPITNWTEFFKEPRDIYAQNVSNCQVSVEFETSPGYKTGFLFPQTRDPVNLTQSIPFDSIKSSVDFRKMLNRRPPALKLMDYDEFLEYYKKKASQMNIAPEDAIDKAAERLQRIHNKQDYTTDERSKPLHTVTEDGQLFGEKKRVAASDQISEDEIIHPKVLHLCNQVHHEIPDKEKMRAHVMLDELATIEDQLKIDDLEYIRSKGYYKTVKNFARNRIAQLSETESEGAEDNFASM